MKTLSKKMITAMHASKTDLEKIYDALSKHFNSKEKALEIIKSIKDHEFEFDGQALRIWADCCQMSVDDLVTIDDHLEEAEQESDFVDVNMNLSVNMPKLPKEAATDMKKMVSEVFEAAQAAIDERSNEIAANHGMTKVEIPEAMQAIIGRLANGLPDELRSKFLNAATDRVKKMADGRSGCFCGQCDTKAD